MEIQLQTCSVQLDFGVISVLVFRCNLLWYNEILSLFTDCVLDIKPFRWIPHYVRLNREILWDLTILGIFKWYQSIQGSISREISSSVVIEH